MTEEAINSKPVRQYDPLHGKTRRKGHETYVQRFHFDIPSSGLGDSYSTAMYNDTTTARKVWRKRDKLATRRECEREIEQILSEEGF